jgi:hypothetical protein
MEDKKIEAYYQIRAKEIIDSMFDCKIFNEKMSRDDMNGFEDLMAFHFQCFAESNRKMADFQAKWKDKITN